MLLTLETWIHAMSCNQKRKRNKIDHMVSLESVRVAQPLNYGIPIRLQDKNSKVNTDIKIKRKIKIDRHEKDPK